MVKKISEIQMISEGLGKYKLALGRSDYFAIKLGILQGVENPKKFFIFPSNKMSLYTTQETEEFNKKILELAPNLVEYTNGSEESIEAFEAAKMEWEDLPDDKKWMLLKVLSYFGEQDEIIKMKKIIKETGVFYLDWVNKQEVDDIKKETKGFGAKLKDFIEEIKSPPEKNNNKD